MPYKKNKVTRKKFIFIAGPCIIESARSTLEIASVLKDITQKYAVDFFFKASYDKANRTAASSYRGPGLMPGLRILEKVKKTLGIRILSDVHCVSQVEPAQDILDVIQIPAFLCRQTDLILAAARTKKIINIKKAQFIAPWDVRYIIEKVESTGNKDLFITERGTSFGYNNLVVDFRSFGILSCFGYPVIFDGTHSVQKPSAAQGISGGDRQFVFPLCRAAAAFGVDGLFLEVHPDPHKALSDKSTSIALGNVEKILRKVIEVNHIAHEA